MTRTAKLANYFDSEQLYQKYRKSQNCVESKRWQLLWKISLGWNIKQSAMIVGIHYQYALKIVKQYNQLGPETVLKKRVKPEREQHKGGKKPLLNSAQMKKLCQALLTRPFDQGIWTGPKVARWIEKETGKEKIWNQRGWEYLKKQGYSCQKPRPKHKKGIQLNKNNLSSNCP
jgi:transposase